MTTKEQVIQAARDAGYKYKDVERMCETFPYFDLEKFYNLAYKAGEKAMQERAAKTCQDMADPRITGYAGVLSNKCADAIRALEVK